MCALKKGIAYIMLSSVCFAVVNFCVKLLSDTDTIRVGQEVVDLGLQTYSPLELVFFRSLISLILSAIALHRLGLPFLGNNRKWLLVRGTAGATALTMFFFTLRELPLAVATTVQYLSPFFTVLIARFLMKERVTVLQGLFFMVAFVGVVLMGFGRDRTEGEVDLFWLGLGLLSAMFSGVAYNAILKCKDTDHAVNIVVYFPLVATPVCALLLAPNFFTGNTVEGLPPWTTPQGWEWLLIVTLGVFTQMAQIFMTKALHLGSPVVITPFKYFGAIYAYLIGLFVFFEELNHLTLIGIGLILIGVVLNSVYKLLVKALRS